MDVVEWTSEGPRFLHIFNLEMNIGRYRRGQSSTQVNSCDNCRRKLVSHFDTPDSATRADIKTMSWCLTDWSKIEIAVIEDRQHFVHQIYAIELYLYWRRL